jgi:hypothetical protein
MSEHVRPEAVNPFSEVQRRFRGVWRKAKAHYKDRFGDPEAWPEAHNLKIEGYDAFLEPHNRRLIFVTNDTKVRTEVIFSDRDGSTVGLTVTQGDTTNYLTPRILRERVVGPGAHKERHFVWQSSEGVLIEARFHLDDRNRIAYYSQPQFFDGQEFAPWEKIKYTREGWDGPFDLAWEIDSAYPSTFRRCPLVDGVVPQWRIDAPSRIEEIKARSGMRTFPVEEVGYHL